MLDFSLVLSNVTAFNAGSGNTSISVRAATTLNGTYSEITSMTISTNPAGNGGGIYPLPYFAGPFVKIGFGTAVTGSAANANIDLILYNEVGST